MRIGKLSLIGVILSCTPSAFAVDYGAVNAVGDWGTAASWTPGGGPPVASDRAFIGTNWVGGSAATATINVTDPRSIKDIFVGGFTGGTLGTLNINGGGSLAVTTDVMLGHSSNAVVSLNTGGTLSVGGQLRIAEGVASTFNYNGGTLTANTIFSGIYGAGTFNLGNSLTTTTFHMAYFTGSTGNLLSLGGNDLTTQNLYLSFGDLNGGGSGTITRGTGGNIITGLVDIRGGTNWAFGAGDQVNSTFQGYWGSSSAVNQLTGETTGLTLGTVLGTGALDISTFGSHTLKLNFDAGSGGGDWIFRWANPNTGDRVATINNLITAGRITVSGIALLDRQVANGGDGFTYVRSIAVIPEPTSLGLVGLAGIGLLRRRRA